MTCLILEVGLKDLRINLKAAFSVSMLCMLLINNLASSSDTSPKNSISLRRVKECGPETYVKKSDPLCGVDKYIEAKTEFCGVKNYNTKQDHSCPGFVASKFAWGTTADSPTGIRCLRGTEAKFCRWEVDDRADDSSNWSDYYDCSCHYPEVVKSCEKEEFGIKEYKSCRHSSHGVDSYKVCSRKEFGVATYKACKILKTRDELFIWKV